jgi:hypothetical protein
VNIGSIVLTTDPLATSISTRSMSRVVKNVAGAGGSGAVAGGAVVAGAVDGGAVEGGAVVSGDEVAGAVVPAAVVGGAVVVGAVVVSAAVLAAVVDGAGGGVELLTSSEPPHAASRSAAVARGNESVADRCAIDPSWSIDDRHGRRQLSRWRRGGVGRDP